MTTINNNNNSDDIKLSNFNSNRRRIRLYFECNYNNSRNKLYFHYGTVIK